LSASKPELNRLKNKKMVIAHRNVAPPSFMIAPASC